MTRVLITGMSGMGKSTIIEELSARGYRAVDLDQPGWSAYLRAAERHGGAVEWMWIEDKVRDLLEDDDSEVLFVSGTSSNQGSFYHLLDHVVLLSAPVEVIEQRVRARKNNSYGKQPEELAEILHNKETIEPLLRRSATIEIDAAAQLSEVVDRLVRLVQP